MTVPAHCGMNACLGWFQAAISILKQEYTKEEMTMKKACTLAVKVLNKTLDMTKLTPEKGRCRFLFYMPTDISYPLNVIDRSC